MIDRRLPPSLFQVGQCLFTLLSQAIFLAIVQPMMALTSPFTSIAVYFIQKLYLINSRQLRLFDLETRAQLNSSFLETLEGVATIRTFGWQRAFVKDNCLMMCLQRWLNVTMHLMVLCIAILVISLAVAFKDRTTWGQIGIALNVVLLANQSLLRLVESWAIMETFLGAISRTGAFERDVAPEDQPGEDRLPGNEWPAHGALIFKDRSATHDSKHLALKDIAVTIESGHKSCLLLSLLRLVEIQSGAIWIDGLDLQTLSRTCECWPSAGPHQNSGESTHAVTDTSNLQVEDSSRSSLDMMMGSLPLSQGQQQLFSLARAILMRPFRGNIVLLDEATSSVDAEADKFRVQRSHRSHHCPSIGYHFGQ
ncbi:oligomycin resistance ATP-dependent permease yor1 [Rhexocercosporidium sp. MPI-PUGE-AT-0058]|nr:oligomycin resistance ATP-dependent permease yor1 [Rhexocercosporidium sp. MPI-PUGE-AT-0058]